MSFTGSIYLPSASFMTTSLMRNSLSGVAVGVGDGVGVRIRDWMAVAVGVGVAVKVEIGDCVDVAVGVGVGFIRNLSIRF